MCTPLKALVSGHKSPHYVDVAFMYVGACLVKKFSSKGIRYRSNEQAPKCLFEKGKFKLKLLYTGSYAQMVHRIANELSLKIGSHFQSTIVYLIGITSHF